VLLLHSFGPQFVPWVFFAGQFREEPFKLSPEKIDLYEASLEGSRFQQPEEQRPIVDYLVASGTQSSIWWRAELNLAA
jgi:hypothetical protein